VSQKNKKYQNIFFLLKQSCLLLLKSSNPDCRLPMYWCKLYFVLCSEPEGTDPQLLIANLWDLRHLSIEGKPLTPSFLKVDQKIENLDFDHRQQKVFWVS